jgi:hypothetical protein
MGQQASYWSLLNEKEGRGGRERVEEDEWGDS